MIVDGHVCDSLSVWDRGLHYGDGLFETIAAVEGHMPLWDRHMARLSEGCLRLGLPMPTPQTLRTEAEGLIAGDSRCVVKIMVTRGVGGRGYKPPASPQATRIVLKAPWPVYPRDFDPRAVTVQVCETTLRRGRALAGLKHLNRLEQVLARREWDDARVAEGLMLDDDGHVVEATAANIFSVRDRRIITPVLNSAGVRGVVRDWVLTLATQAGYGWCERELDLAELFEMDELFLTNSLIGIWQVRTCLGAPREFDVGPATVGADLRRHLRNQGMTWLAVD